MNIKKTIITSATIGASLLLSVAPALAAPNPKATGSIVWMNGGSTASDSFNAIQTSVSCGLNVSGNYNVGFTLTGDPVTVYTHHVTLAQTGSSVTGSGGYPVSGGDTYHWNITAGTVTGNTINLTMVYNLGATNTVMHMTGAIAPDGSMSGTWNDNFGGERTGNWNTSSGNATIPGCEGKGSFTYSDTSGISYVMDVKYVNVSDNSSWFAGPTVTGNFGIGTWIFIRVVDNGQPGVNHDQIYGQVVANESAAKYAVASMQNPLGGPFTIQYGNLVVH